MATTAVRWSAGVLLPDALRGPGEFLSEPLWVPPEARQVEAVIVDRAGWMRLLPGRQVLALSIEMSRGLGWDRIASAGTDGAPLRRPDGSLVSDLRVRGTLPSVRVPIPQVRLRVTCESPCQCTAEFFWVS